MGGGEGKVKTEIVDKKGIVRRKERRRIEERKEMK